MCELRNFNFLVKNKATKGATRVCYIRTALQSAWIGKVCLYISTSAWGFGVARFDKEGQCEGLHIVERATDDSTFLFCMDFGN